jgi:hypothetical protein
MRVSVLKLYDRGTILLFFFITAANSGYKLYYWFFQSGRGTVNFPYYDFLATACLAAGLFMIRYAWNNKNFTLPPESPGLTIALTLWLIAATLSLIKNVTIIDAFKSYISGIIIPMIIYLALRGSYPDDIKINRIFFAISLGLLTPLLLGIAAYYREWGIPDHLAILAYSRYDLARMESYMQVTYGNTGHIAQLILLTGPPLLVLALDKNRPRLLRIWFGGCVVLMGLNLLIVQSMTSFGVILAAFLLIIMFRKYYKFFIFSLIALLIGWLVLPGTFWAGSFRLLMGRQGSFLQRVDAMRDGLDVFLNNWMFGVGEGLSHLYISAATAHQFFIQQGVELGVLGFIASILIVAVVFMRMFRIVASGSGDPDNINKFILIIGPFSYLLYGVIANVAINIGTINIWICLFVAFLALADCKPPGEHPQDGLDSYCTGFSRQFGQEFDKIPDLR